MDLSDQKRGNHYEYKVDFRVVIKSFYADDGGLFLDDDIFIHRE